MTKEEFLSDKFRELCPDCGVKVGYCHKLNCDVERCSVCGLQKLSCYCKGHKRGKTRWNGYWPYTLECVDLEWFSKFENGKWIDSDIDDPESMCNYNRYIQVVICGRKNGEKEN